MINRNPLLRVPFKKSVSICIGLILINYPIKNTYADLIPAGNSSLYYKIGGGQPVPIPAYSGAQSVPLNVEGSVGLGYNCGAFNPASSITNSLNGIQNSFQNIQQNVIYNATAAITQFPLYAISRADPSLYNLINNGLFGAREDLNISTKTCQQMQSEITSGQNPYSDWATVSMGNDWKHHMSLAGNRNLKAVQIDNNSDINQVKQKIEKENGDNGVPWVKGVAIGRNTVYAGGRNQPAIYIIHDTAVAGYNIILQPNRRYDDTSAPAKTNANQHLLDTWPNPVTAARWMTTVLGDEKITTFSHGDKHSSPGVGLLSDHEELATEITQNMQRLVTHQQPLSIDNLKKISAPGVMINTAIIRAIQQKAPVEQAILINKLSQEVAAAKVIDKALLAKQILEEGSQIPAIYGNKAAQKTIKDAVLRLDHAIHNLLFSVQVRKELVSRTAAELLNTTQVEQLNSTSIQGSEQDTIIDQGAIKK